MLSHEKGITMRWLLASIAWVGVAVFAAACGGSPAAQCTTGQSIACTGVGGCSGFQTCQVDGTYGVCQCGGPDGGIFDASPDGSEPDASSLDSAGDAPVGDGGVWTPKQLSGLALWLDDTVGIVQDLQNAGHVKRWLDQSGNANDATAQCTNACPGALPNLDPAVIHGHDAVTCGANAGNGTGLFIADAPSLQFGTGDWGVAIVYRLAPTVASNNSLWLWSKNNGQGNALVFSQSSGTAVTMAVGANSLVASVTQPTKFQYFIGRGTALYLKSPNGTSTGPTTTADISHVGAQLAVCDNMGINTGVGEVAEILAVKGTLSDGDVGNIIAYFQNKFAL